MRVWLITVGEPLPTDGSDVRLYRSGLLANRLTEQGHEVVWWTSTFDHMAKKQRFGRDTIVDIRGGCRLILLHSCAYKANISLSRILNHIGIARAFTRLAGKEPKPDIILASLPTLELARAAVAFGKANGVPVVVDIRDLWPDIFIDLVPPVLKPICRLLLKPLTAAARQACAGATSIIGITQPIVEWGLHYAGRPARMWDRAFPLGYSQTRPSDEELEIAREFWRSKGIGPDDKQFLACFFGTMGRQFDLATVIAAAKLLEAERRNIRFVLCGQGDNFEKYREDAAACKNIVFPGWVGASEIWVLMRLAKVGLAPYNSTPDFEKSIPNKVIEYFSAGLPLVSSLQGLVADILLQYNCGVTYWKGNPQELANILINLQESPVGMETMAENAATLYGQRFVAEKIYDDLIKHLQAVVHHYNAGA